MQGFKEHFKTVERDSFGSSKVHRTAEITYKNYEVTDEHSILDEIRAKVHTPSDTHDNCRTASNYVYMLIKISFAIKNACL